MDNFGDAYSQAYDLIYGDKDYASEVSYLETLIDRHLPAADSGRRRSILDLGCGTGRHAEALARSGHRVVGVDRSEAMIQRARLRCGSLDESRFLVGDITTLDLDARFDVGLALFHVICYQVENPALASAFRQVSRHLVQGGLFVFDFWYGPAVLLDPPLPRLRRIDSQHSRIIRFTEPSLDAARNTVLIRYHLLVQDLASGAWSEDREDHPMRYLFLPEMDLMLDSAGLDRVAEHKWLSMEPGLPESSWNGVIVARKR